MDQIANFKVEVRRLRTLMNSIRIQLDSGNYNSLYENLDQAQAIVGSFNKSLRELEKSLGKTLDKHKEV